MGEAQTRRLSDREVDPAVEVYVQHVVSDTRHTLRAEIATLAAQQAAAQLQATKEHGEVRADIQDLRAEVSAARRDIADLVPLKDAVAELKRHDDIGDARDEALQQLKSAQTRQFRWLAGLIVAAVPSVVALVTFIH